MILYRWWLVLHVLYQVDVAMTCALLRIFDKAVCDTDTDVHSARAWKGLCLRLPADIVASACPHLYILVQSTFHPERHEV